MRRKVQRRRWIGPVDTGVSIGNAARVRPGKGSRAGVAGAGIGWAMAAGLGRASTTDLFFDSLRATA